MIDEMTERHVTQVCQIHIEALPDSFLPSLGLHFLKVVYNGILEYGLGFGYVYMQDDKVVGFVLASIDTGNLFSKIIKRKWTSLLLPILINAIKTPSMLIKMCETIFYPSKEEDSLNSELLVIAVHKDCRRKNIGRELIRIMNLRFQRENIYKYKVSVYSDNKAANEFYKSVGFNHEGSFTLYKKKFNVYKYELAKKDGRPQ